MASQGRSFTHPVMNLTGIASGHDAADRFTKLITEVRLPEDSFFPLIHEATHHWFFHTPVGLALSQLQLDMAEMVAATAGADQAVFDDVWTRLGAEGVSVEDFFGSRYLRYKAAVKMLDPILEGTACFAEFDLLPGDLEIMSPPLSSVYAFYMSAPGDEGLKASEVRAQLAVARLSESGIKEKLRVLSQPLDSSPNNYLGSYLFVKNVWTSCFNADRRLEDPELFLMFLRSLFLNDWGVVDALLSDEYDADSHIRVIARLNHLYTKLAEGNPVPLVDRLMEQLANWRTIAEPTRFDDSSEMVASLDVIEDLTEDESMRAAGISRMALSLGRLAQSELAGRAWIVAQREAICLLHEPVTVLVGPTGDRLIASLPNGAPVASLPLDAPGTMAPGSKSDGYLNYYYFASQPGFIYGVSVGGGFVASHTSGTAAPEVLEQYRSFVTSTDEMLDALALIDQFAASLVSEEGGESYDIMNAYVERSSTKFYEDNLVGTAFPYLDERGWDAIRNDVATAGISGVFGTSYERARGLALVSLLAALRFERDFASNEFDRLRDVHGYAGGMGDLIHEVQSVARTRLHDEQLLMWDDQGVFCSV